MKIGSTTPPLPSATSEAPPRTAAARVQVPRGHTPESSFERVGPARAQRLPAAPVSPLGMAFEGIPAPTVTAGVRLLPENVEAWLSILHVLEHGTGPLDASYFILQRDIFGMAFLGGLLHRAKEGDPVRLMVDAQGDSLGRKGFTLSFRGQDYLQELVASGNAEVRVYHPLHKKAFRAMAEDVARFGAVASNHDKILRRNEFVITGGRNVSKDYFTAPEDRSDVYRDTDVLLTGKAASREAKKAFDAEWSEEAVHFRAYGDLFGNLRRRDAELLGAYAMMRAWTGADGRLPPALSDADRAALRQDSPLRDGMAGRLLAIALADAKSMGVDHEPTYFERQNLKKLARELAGYPALHGAAKSFDVSEGLIPEQAVKILDRTSAATQKADEIGKALIAIADRARERIVLQNPYVVLTPGAVAALERASARGVKIDLYTNSPASTDSVLTQAFFLEDWPRLLARIPNLRIFAHTGEQKLHAKTALADGEIALVSSVNLDLLSEKINGEIAALAHSKKLTARLAESYAADAANPAHGLVEYRIERDAQGRPVIRDGEPVVAYGPRDHVGGFKMFQLGVLQWLVRHARKLPFLADIQQPALPAKL